MGRAIKPGTAAKCGTVINCGTAVDVSNWFAVVYVKAAPNRVKSLKEAGIP